MSWTKVKHELPPIEYTHRDRGYTVEEVQKMIESGCQGRLREKAVILLLTSAGGMRIGAIPKLKKGDLNEMQTSRERKFTGLGFILIPQRTTLRHVVPNVLRLSIDISRKDAGRGSVKI